MFESIRRLFGSNGGVPTGPPPPPAPPPEAPFEYIIVHGRDVRDAMARAAKPGIVPVLLGTASDVEQIVEGIDPDATPEDIAASGLAIDVDAWMKERTEVDSGHWDELRNDQKLGSGDPGEALSGARDVLTKEYYDEVFIGLIPAAEPWLVPASLGYGGWNDCPMPDVQVAFCKRWFDRYGAVVTQMSGDVFEFSVARPPQSAEEAFVLAKEHFIYCPDIVHQGTRTLGNLAATIKGSAHWYFWWD